MLAIALTSWALIKFEKRASKQENKPTIV